MNNTSIIQVNKLASCVIFLPTRIKTNPAFCPVIASKASRAPQLALIRCVIGGSTHEKSLEANQKKNEDGSLAGIQVSCPASAKQWRRHTTQTLNLTRKQLRRRTDLDTY